jgi:hypothetical protein
LISTDEDEDATTEDWRPASRILATEERSSSDAIVNALA